MCSALFLRAGGLCGIFAYRTRHTACVARCVLGWLMSDLCLYIEGGIQRV